MAKGQKSSVLTGIAGVHYVVSELSRRGLVALATVRNLAAYDVIAVSEDGKRHANIQVKTSSKRAGFWLMPPPEKIRAGRSDCYVFLRRTNDDKGYEGFMLSGREVRDEVRREVQEQQRRVRDGKRRKVWPSLHVGRD
ncbi:MAG: hypothetical protein V3U28_06110, partial [Candidatus Acidoferrales bacterium]